MAILFIMMAVSVFLVVMKQAVSCADLLHQQHIMGGQSKAISAFSFNSYHSREVLLTLPECWEILAIDE